MNQKIIIQAGFNGVGKTTLSKTFAIKFPASNVWVFDPHGDYPEYDKFNGEIPTVSEFKEIVSKKVRNSLIIYEEATIFFRDSRLDEDTLKQLISLRQRNNTILFNFHFLRKIPIDILEIAHLLIVKRTNDRTNIIFEKFKDFPEILEAYNFVNNPKYWKKAPETPNGYIFPTKFVKLR